MPVLRMGDVMVTLVKLNAYNAVSCSRI